MIVVLTYSSLSQCQFPTLVGASQFHQPSEMKREMCSYLGGPSTSSLRHTQDFRTQHVRPLPPVYRYVHFFLPVAIVLTRLIYIQDIVSISL